MACVVYCLVPDPEQLDPLVERLKDAGVMTEDIAVVPRRHWPCRSQTGRAPAPGTETVPDSLWCLSLTPAAFWWQWALGLQAATGMARAQGHTVIPLDVYESKSDALKRK